MLMLLEPQTPRKMNYFCLKTMGIIWSVGIGNRTNTAHPHQHCYLKAF